jgi:hypothetical protein
MEVYHLYVPLHRSEDYSQPRISETIMEDLQYPLEDAGQATGDDDYRPEFDASSPDGEVPFHIPRD